MAIQKKPMGKLDDESMIKNKFCFWGIVFSYLILVNIWALWSLFVIIHVLIHWFMFTIKGIHVNFVDNPYGVLGFLADNWYMFPLPFISLALTYFTFYLGVLPSYRKYQLLTSEKDPLDYRHLLTKDEIKARKKAKTKGIYD